MAERLHIAVFVRLLVLCTVQLALAQMRLCPSRCYCIGTITRCTRAQPKYTTIPEDIDPSTTALELNNNRIQFLHSGSFTGLTKLTSLVLANNEILFVSAYAFEELVNLQILNLQSNNIQDIQPYTFLTLGSLKILTLQGNSITELHKHSFYGMQTLQTLFLGNNQLQALPQESLEPLEMLSQLVVEGNAMQCDCSMAWLRDYSPVEDIQCAGPEPLEGMTINEVPLEALQCVSPTISTPTNTIHGFKGETIFLFCSTSGDPSPTAHWEFMGKTLTDSIHYRLYDNGTLVIVSMLASLEGDYQCVAENIMGNTTVSITVVYEGDRVPRFLLKPINTHTFEGETFTLNCRGDQFTITYTWLKDGVELQGSDRVKVEEGGEGAKLVVSEAVRADSGVYTCILLSEDGQSQASAVANVTGPLLTCDGIITSDSVAELRSRIEFAFNATQQELLSSSHSPSSLLRRLRFPQNGSLEILKAAEVFQQAIQMYRDNFSGNASKGPLHQLTPCEVAVLANLSGCLQHQRTADCSDLCYHMRYRTLDGTCNNLDQSLWGSANTPFHRLLDPAYEDGLGLPVGWSEERPSARLVTRSLIAAKQVTSNEAYTHMLMQVGQFLDHDIDLTPSSGSEFIFTEDGETCDATCDNQAPCFPIPVPEGDPRIKGECIHFTRSSAVCGTGASSLLVGRGGAGVRREQVNAITSFIDGSQIYGSDNHTAMRLRDTSSGKGQLTRGMSSSLNQHFLPFDNHSLIQCDTGPSVGENRSRCFLAGDVRANEQVGLTSMHTLFYREHNRVASTLATLNPHWDDERIYQEARRIVIAKWQNIVTAGYLPKILGSQGMEIMGSYKGYEPSTDPSIANAFATAAFRFGHSQIMPLFPRLAPGYTTSLPVGPLLLQHAFFAPFRILEEGGVDPLIRGLIATPIKQRSSSQGLNSNLTEALFAQVNEVALDLASLNIQRGRDHGLPSYNHWRDYCKLRMARSVTDLSNEISNVTILNKLRELYSDKPNTIDLWVGGLIEDMVAGSQLGPTFLCIIASQFKRLRDGDRFWYERPGQFLPDQLVQLRTSSLSRIICDNADNITTVPKDAFILQSPAHFVSCDSLPQVELGLWTDCQGSCLATEDDRVRRSGLLEPQDDSTQQDFLEIMQRLERLESRMSTRAT